MPGSCVRQYRNAAALNLSPKEQPEQTPPPLPGLPSPVAKPTQEPMDKGAQDALLRGHLPQQSRVDGEGRSGPGRGKTEHTRHCPCYSEALPCFIFFKNTHYYQSSLSLTLKKYYIFNHLALFLSPNSTRPVKVGMGSLAGFVCFPVLSPRYLQKCCPVAGA